MGKLIKGSTWFDKDKEEEVFGIKVKMDGKWYDAGDDSGLLFFDTKEAAAEEVKGATKEITGD